MNPSLLAGFIAIESSCLVAGLKVAIPVTTTPLPKAHDAPVKVTLMLKTFLPVGRGVAVPFAAHPNPDELTAPNADTVTVVD